MGRKPIPTNVHVLRGTYRVDRHGKIPPVQPAKQRPRIPGHLEGHARAAWLNLAPMLDARGLLTDADAMALERACQCYAEIRDLEATLARDGRSYRAETVDRHGNKVEGLVRMRPEVATLADADRRFRAWLSEFGLTPAARAKVDGTPSPADETDDGEQFFR